MQIQQKQVANLITDLASKANKATGLTAGTFPKITFNNEGIVTEGEVLQAADIPNLSAGKITSDTFHVDRIPSLNASKITAGIFSIARGGTGLNTVANGNYIRKSAGAAMEARTPANVKTDIGLANVTNDKQVKAAASSVSGNIPLWSGAGGDLLADNSKGVVTIVGPESGAGSASDDNIPTEKAVRSAIDDILTGSEAMVFAGVLDCSFPYPDYPEAEKAGMVWKVGAAGKIGGNEGDEVEVGDTIFSLAANAGGTQAAVGTHFSILQTNIWDYVTITSSHDVDEIAIFGGESANSRILKSGGKKISDIIGVAVKQAQAKKVGLDAAAGATLTVEDFGVTHGVVANTVPRLTFNGLEMIYAGAEPIGVGEFGVDGTTVKIKSSITIEAGDVFLLTYNQITP